MCEKRAVDHTRPNLLTHFLPHPVKVAEATPEELLLIPSPATGVPGDLTEPRAFNLMFQTQVGALEGSSSTAYLRPETAQVFSLK